MSVEDREDPLLDLSSRKLTLLTSAGIIPDVFKWCSGSRVDLVGRLVRAADPSDGDAGTQISNMCSMLI